MFSFLEENKLHFNSLSYLKFLLISPQGRDLVLWAPVALGCGISIYFQLVHEPTIGWSFLCLGLFLGGIFLKILNPIFIRLWYFSFLVSLGFTVSQFKTYLLATPLLEKPIFTQSLKGEIEDIEPTSRGLKIGVHVDSIDNFPSNARLPRKLGLRLNGKNRDALKPGSKIEVQAKLFPTDGAFVPGGFDFKRKAYFLGIGGTGIIYKVKNIQPPQTLSWGMILKNLRHSIGTSLYENLKGPEGAIAGALIIGEKGRIPTALRDIFSDVGIAHILAISGLHLSLVGGLIFFAIRRGLALVPWISLKYNTKKLAAFLSTLAAFFYLHISGGAISIQRAFLMFLITMGAILLERQILTLRSVAIVAFAILCFMPESLMMPSFQLSFAAVVALIATYEKNVFQKFLSKDQGYMKKIFFYGIGMMGTTVVASCATLPFTIYHFHKFTGLGILGNFMAIPLLSFWIMPCAILSILLMPLNLSSISLSCMEKGIHFIIQGATFIVKNAGFSYLIPSLPSWGLAGAVFGGLILCLAEGQKRLLGFLGVGVFLMALFFINVPKIYMSADLKTIGFIAPTGHLVLNKSRQPTFIGSAWASWAGIPESKVMRFQDFPDIKCTNSECRMRVGDRNILYLKNLKGFSEASCQADILVSIFPLRGLRQKCKTSSLTFDRGDGWKNGAYVLWVAGPLRSLNVRQAGGRRWG